MAFHVEIEMPDRQSAFSLEDDLRVGIETPEKGAIGTRAILHSNTVSEKEHCQRLQIRK